MLHSCSRTMMKKKEWNEEAGEEEAMKENKNERE
jgi:hypothetical protein